jgi:hypothetical protein
VFHVPTLSEARRGIPERYKLICLAVSLEPASTDETHLPNGQDSGFFSV